MYLKRDIFNRDLVKEIFIVLFYNILINKKVKFKFYFIIKLILVYNLEIK